MDAIDEPDQRFQRVAALDLGKISLTACIRTPSVNAGRRRQEVREYSTMSRSLLALADWLRCEGIELVAMEATSSYWKPAFYLLEAEGFTCWLLNAKHVKNVPGRPKTDKIDAVWLAKVVEWGLCTPSLVHPKPIRQLRDLTRYRRCLVRERTREKQRVEKLLEDAQIKISAVITDIFGVSGRTMMEALIKGQRTPKTLAQLAHGKLRAKIDVLEEAFTGHFEDHHGFLLRSMLAHIDSLSDQVDQVAARIDTVIAPFSSTAQRLDEITGVGQVTAQELLAEIGPDVRRFPSPAHLVSWAKFAPIDHNSAGKKRGGTTTGKGNPWLAGTLGEVAASIGRTNTFLGQRYRRLARRRGKKRALVAVGNSVLTVIWHLLADPEGHYHDLGPDYYLSKISSRRRERDLIRQLERLTGQKVMLQPAPAA